ncbi:MAG: PAS domain S-box protein, partial [Mariprofundus sp.]|nr:PAS domain S-box protein [Mariprofundus sp.]
MIREVISVEPDCLLKQAVAIMQQHKISFLVVAKDHWPTGVLSERDIVRLACQQIDPEQIQVKDVMTSPVITVAEDANIFQVYDLLSTRKIRHMVVIDDAGLIAGLATLTNILGGLSIEYFVELKQIANIMSQNICTLKPDDTVQQALELMTDKRISCVIITKQKKPVGIITERDITRLYGSDMLETARLESIMSKPVRTTTSDMFIPEANAIMQKEKLRHLVIVHANGHLAGLISQTDIARRIEEHYVGYLRTLLKQQNRKLQFEHERFSILFEKNPNAVLSYNIDGNLVDLNPAAIALGCYSPKEMIGRPIDAIIYPDDRHLAQTSFDQATAGETGHAEFRVLQKSGQIAHVFNSYLPIYSYNILHRIYSIMHDISDKKLAEQQVQAAEEKSHLLSKAVEAAGDSVIITNRDGTIEFVNAAFTRITGYTSEEAIGSKPSMLKSGEQNRAFYEQMWNSITNGKPWHSRLVDRRKDGQFFPAELSISPVHNVAGEVTHFVGITRDLTEREALEEQFRQAQKMEAIGTLVGGIAHDFNNMLAGITGNLYLASRKSQDNPDVMQKLDNIERLSFRAADMIKQLLDFARKGQVSMKKMQLVPFIGKTLKLLQTLVPANITLHKDICTDELIVTGDVTLLHQILMNLLNNARDALDGVDNPCITVKLEKFNADETFIRTHADVSKNHYAHLSIEDNGCGIPEHQIEHLFEPFFTTKEQGKGTGLGLSMVFG